MPNLTSPGVALTESDFTAIIPSASSVTGAICGTFQAGPVGIPTLVGSEAELVRIFGTPTDSVYTTFFTAANFLQYSNSLYVVRADSTANYNATANTGAATQIKILNRDDLESQFPTLTSTANTKFAAQYSGTKGNSLTIAICSDRNKLDSFGAGGAAITANTAVGSNTIICSANVQSYITTGATSSLTQSIYISGTALAANVVSVNNNTIVLDTTLATVAANTASVRFKWNYASAFDTPLGTSNFVKNASGSNDEMHILLIDTLGKITGLPGSVVEKYPNVSKASDAVKDDGSTNYYVEVLKQQSAHIWVTSHFDSTWGATATSTNFNSIDSTVTSFIGGASGTPTAANVTAGYQLFADKENIDVSLLLTGDGEGSSAVINAVMAIADTRKDCIACVSPATLSSCLPTSTLASADIVSKLATYKTGLSTQTSYSIMDSAWKYQFDKYWNKYRYVPLNGDIAGLIARTETNQDAWWSPAGFSRGKILNAIKLSWNPNQTQRDELYKISINPVVSEPNEGILLYGDKTMLSSSSAFSRINVRRLFIILEKAIGKAAKYALFDFNDEFTRAQFISLVDPFIRNIKAKRGIYDYKIICDTTNNTLAVIDANQFIGSIYIKPARSINYIQLNFVAVGTAIDFSTITNSVGL